MSAEIAQLPTRPAVDRAWRRYCELVQENVLHDLRTDLPHQQAIARAWAEWRDLYLASVK